MTDDVYSISTSDLQGFLDSGEPMLWMNPDGSVVFSGEQPVTYAWPVFLARRDDYLLGEAGSVEAFAEVLTATLQANAHYLPPVP